MKRKFKLLMFLMIISFMFTLSVKAEGTIKLVCNTSNSNTATCKINLSVSDVDDTTPLDINYSTNDLDVKISARGASGTNCNTSKCTVTNIQSGDIATITITNPTENEVKPTISIESIYGSDNKTFTIKGVKKTTTTTTTTTKAKSDNNYLASIIVDGVPLKDFSKSKTKYFIELENDVVNANIKAEAEDENAKVEIDGPKSLNVGDNEYTISVTSENNTTKFYKVIVTRKDEDESSNTDIKSIKIKGYRLSFDKNSKTFHLNINKEDTELDITVNTKDKNASYEIEGNESLKDGSVIKIIVTAEDGSSDTYRIIIEKKESNVVSFIIVGIMLIIIIGLVIFFIIKKNKDKSKKSKKDEQPPKKEIKKESYTEEKTIEMPVINTDDNVSKNEDIEDDDIPLIDNDEEEETRILSYAEREELERNKLLDNDVSNTIDEELDKTLLFNYNENNDEDDEY